METKTFETAEKKERVILVAVATSDNDDTVQSLDELEELVQTAGAETVAKVIQNRERIHPGTYIGKGKIEEIQGLIYSLGVDTVICDDELSPAQNYNLEEALDVKVIDRTVLILDIFAKRASTSEGKLQVELAQLRYRASHLIGGRSGLSRLGAGIGTRGPGEQKLEVDRRIIKERITQVRRELENVKQTRELTRKKRQENFVPVVAIAGYTNAGKSTLLNKLTGAGVLSEDKLFATLDPVTRRLSLENGGEMLFTDTVGFIRKLPHHLIQAFRSTLEEAKYADIILHVADCSNPDIDNQMYTVYDTLGKLGIGDKKIVTAFNKIDLFDGDVNLKDLRADKTVKISAKNGTGLEKLLDVLTETAKEGKVILERVFPYNEASKINEIHKAGQVIEEDYRNNGIYVRADIPREYMYMFEK
ncbi:MAG: GTPase HflX [Lachnospiraceae bacterium]|nr:GTPase HflX [Lachnospiraceae bacterium]